MATRASASSLVADPLTSEQDLAEKERQRAADWAMIEHISERNADKDPELEMAFITEVVEEVRQELYEREQQRKAEGRR